MAHFFAIGVFSRGLTVGVTDVQNRPYLPGDFEMARPPRLERGTLCLEGRCSIQLSYGRT
jgi:hypothetical protein